MPAAQRTTPAQAFAYGICDFASRQRGYVDGLIGAPRKAPDGCDKLSYELGHQAGTRDRPCCGDRAQPEDRS